MNMKFPFSSILIIAQAIVFSCVFAAGSTVTTSASEVKSLDIISGKTTFQIPAFEHNALLYASFTHFAKKFSFRTYTDDAKGKMEAVINDHRLKMTANNPFIIVLLHKANTIEEVYQLPVEVIRSEAAYYIPVAQFIPLLSKVWGRQITLNKERTELRISQSDAVEGRNEITESVVKETGGVKEETAKEIPSSETKSVKTEELLAPKAVIPEPPKSFDITHLTVDARMNGTLIRIHGTKPLNRYHSNLESGGKLVIEVQNATADTDELRQTPISGEDVRSVSATQSGKNTRIEIQLEKQVTADNIVRDAASNDLLLSLFRKAEVEKIYSEEIQQKKKTADDRRKTKWALDCIVIDPGHGGRDPGAIGVSGIKEKNITLGIALKLGELIEQKMKHMKVVYTRKDDRFIELDKRGRIANEAGGKLFVSIHCNSTEKKPSSANGFEVYLLRPGRTEEAIRIAEFENSVIKLEKDYEKRYAKLTSENFIIVTMAQSAYVKYSERFAEIIHEEVNASKRLKSLGVKQAGFYVLVGASMPSVLIETAFLSNGKDEAFLASQDGQHHLAKLMFQAIEAYAEEYDKSLKD